MTPARRSGVLLAVSVVLAVAAVVLLVAGIEVRETTGGLLVTPIRQVHLVGGYLLAGTAAGVAAVLTALAAFPARPARRQEAPAEEPTTGEATAEGATSEGATERAEQPAPSGEPASLAPGAERAT